MGRSVWPIQPRARQYRCEQREVVVERRPGAQRVRRAGADSSVSPDRRLPGRSPWRRATSQGRKADQVHHGLLGLRDVHHRRWAPARSVGQFVESVLDEVVNVFGFAPVVLRAHSAGRRTKAGGSRRGAPLRPEVVAGDHQDLRRRQSQPAPGTAIGLGIAGCLRRSSRRRSRRPRPDRCGARHRRPARSAAAGE